MRQQVETAYLTRYYKTSPYQSLGQILSYVYVYLGFDAMEAAQAGCDVLTINREKAATITWDEDLKIPVFCFCDTFSRKVEAEAKQQCLIEMLKEKQHG